MASSSGSSRGVLASPSLSPCASFDRAGMSPSIPKLAFSLLLLQEAGASFSLPLSASFRRAGMSPSIPKLAFSLLLLLSADLFALPFITLCVASRMELNAGFSFSLWVNGTDHLGVEAENGGVFVPILSTSNFTQYDSTDHGFSFGMLTAVPQTRETYPIYYYPPDTVFLYLCVCRGHMETSSKGTNRTIRSAADFLSLTVNTLSGSSAAPIWNANPMGPLMSVDASLIVTQDKALELRNANGSLVWEVRNVAAMEIRESGNLVIYNSTNGTVWQSFDHPGDTLVKGQLLNMTMNLTSNNSLYTVALEPRGLIFYYFDPTVVSEPTQYWLLPTLNTSLSGCNDASFASLFDDDYFRVVSGCSGKFDYSFYPKDKLGINVIDFLRLENDGLFRAYSQSGIPVKAVGTVDKFATSVGNLSSQSRYEVWSSCGVPMACGVYSICQSNSGRCVCPQLDGMDYVDSLFPGDPSRGCKPLYLPVCGTAQPEYRFKFSEINDLSSILFISGATFNTTSLADCKQTCSSDCSCMAVFYDRKSNSCFPVSSESPLLGFGSHLSGISFLDLRDNNANVESANYVTYLKVTDIDGNSLSDSLTRSPRFTAGVSVSSVLFLLALAALVFYGRSVLKKRRAKGVDKVELLRLLPSLPTRFSYRELRTATQGFSKLLGAGGFGSVYVGALSDGRQIAVKNLDIIVRGDMSKQFLAEVATIGQTSHSNVVRLIGFCWKTSHQLLVYEYMEKGSLDGWIFNVADEGQVLDWATRFHVVIGIARGLTYLHEECIQPILHLDIKPQNILLDPSFEPKLADFGMSRFIARDVSQVATVARGTPGYIAPELLFSEGAVSKKCDVYSLGMVLLEIVGGRRNVDLSLFMRNVDGENTAVEMRAEEWHFPTWVARMYLEGNVLDVVDKRLNRAFSSEEATRTIEVALWCIQGNPSSRPSAGAVSKWLEGAIPLNQPPVSSIADTQSRVKLSISQSLEASASDNQVLSPDVGQTLITGCSRAVDCNLKMLEERAPGILSSSS